MKVQTVGEVNGEANEHYESSKKRQESSLRVGLPFEPNHSIEKSLEIRGYETDATVKVMPEEEESNKFWELHFALLSRRFCGPCSVRCGNKTNISRPPSCLTLTEGEMFVARVFFQEGRDYLITTCASFYLGAL